MRKPMVTRTITTTTVNVLCLDTETAEPFNTEVKVPRTYKDDKKLLKLVQEMLNTDVVSAVKIVDKQEIECLYGMLEEDFIKYAHVIPPKQADEASAQ